MTLSSAGAIATQSLGAISNQIGVTSRNVAGVTTPGYSKKSANVFTAMDGGPEVDGVRRATDLALFRNVLLSNAAQAQFSVLADGLSRIDQSMNIFERYGLGRVERTVAGRIAFRIFELAARL